MTHGAPLRDETGDLPGRQVPRMPPRGTEAHSSRLRVSKGLMTPRFEVRMNRTSESRSSLCGTMRSTSSQAAM